MEEKIPENRKLSIKDVKVKTTPNVLIKYRKPKTDVELLKKVLGVSTNSEVGELTFEYYKDADAPKAFLNFEGVDSCFYVWMNGAYVGYSQVAHATY